MEHFTSNVARIEQIPQVKLAKFPSPQISSFLEVQSLLISATKKKAIASSLALSCRQV